MGNSQSEEADLLCCMASKARQENRKQRSKSPPQRGLTQEISAEDILITRNKARGKKKKKFHQKKAVPILIKSQSIQKLNVLCLALKTSPPIAIALFSCFNLRQLIFLGQVSKLFYNLAGQSDLMTMCKRRTQDSTNFQNVQQIKGGDIGIECLNKGDPDFFSLVGSNINLDIEDFLKFSHDPFDRRSNSNILYETGVFSGQLKPQLNQILESCERVHSDAEDMGPSHAFKKLNKSPIKSLQDSEIRKKHKIGGNVFNNQRGSFKEAMYSSVPQINGSPFYIYANEVNINIVQQPLSPSQVQKSQDTPKFKNISKFVPSIKEVQEEYSAVLSEEDSSPMKFTYQSVLSKRNI